MLVEVIPMEMTFKYCKRWWLLRLTEKIKFTMLKNPNMCAKVFQIASLHKVWNSVKQNQVNGEMREIEFTEVPFFQHFMFRSI